MESNLKFLEIAEQFNVNRKTNINQNIDQKPHLHIGQLLLQISAAQEDIEGEGRYFITQKICTLKNNVGLL